MKADFYLITEQIATMPKPRGEDWLEDEIKSLKESGFDVIVSLLEPAETEELGLRQEKFFCEKHGLFFLNFPIKDYQIPESVKETLNFIKQLGVFLKDDKKITVHCRQGIGRSSLIVAILLSLKGLSVTEAFEKISTARGKKVPDTNEQIDFVKKTMESLSSL